MRYAVIRTRNRQVLVLRLDTDALQHGVGTEFGKKTVLNTHRLLHTNLVRTAKRNVLFKLLSIFFKARRLH